MPEQPRSRWLVVVAIVAVVAVALLGGRQLAALIPRFVDDIRTLGALGGILFVAGYVVATVALVPGSVLTLAAGAVFGLGLGVALVLLGATLGASAAFLVARYLARGRVERLLSGDARIAAIDRAVERDGRRIVLLLRLSPVFPFNLLNYALGLSKVRFTDYLAGSVGMLPGTVLYVYYGKLAGDVAALAGGVAPSRGAGYYIVLAIGLLATVAVTVLVTKTARRALAGSLS